MSKIKKLIIEDLGNSYPKIVAKLFIIINELVDNQEILEQRIRGLESKNLKR